MDNSQTEQNIPREIFEEMQKLKIKYTQKLINEIPFSLADAYEIFSENPNIESLKNFYSHIHKLTSSSAMYGYKDINIICQEMAILMNSILDGFTVLNPNLIQEIGDKYKVLKDTIANVSE